MKYGQGYNTWGTMMCDKWTAASARKMNGVLRVSKNPESEAPRDYWVHKSSPGILEENQIF